MAQELLKYNINLLYTYVPSIYTRGFMLPSILLNGSVDGIIIVNVYTPEILEMINCLPIPKIFLDTVPSLSEQKLMGDLILIEGYQAEWNITKQFSLIRKDADSLSETIFRMNGQTMWLHTIAVAAVTFRVSASVVDITYYIDEKAKQLPHPIVLTGFDNTGEFTNIAGHIITANVSTELLGRRLALQLVFRTQHPDAPYELTFIAPSIVHFP